MTNIESVLHEFDPAEREKIVQALGILVEAGFMTRLIRLNKNQLVDGRMDWEDQTAVEQEVRDIRQTNRVLLSFQESARQITEKMA